MNSRPLQQLPRPENIDAEQALLGAILVNNDAYHTVSDFLWPEHFSEQLHQGIYETMQSMLIGGGKVTPITMKGYMPPDLMVGELNVIQYLARLAASATTIVNAQNYGQAIADAAMRRAIIDIAGDAAAGSRDANPDIPASKIVDDTIARLNTIRFGASRDTVQWIGDAAAKAVEMAAKAYQTGGRIIGGIDTGIVAVDNLIGPMSPGDLVVVPAPSGSGKTILLAQILMRSAVPPLSDQAGLDYDDEFQAEPRKPIPALLFEMEMQNIAIARRFLASSGLAVRMQKTGRFNQGEYAKLAEAAKKLERVPFAVDEKPGQTADAIIARARQWKQIANVGVIGVDHLGLIRPTNPKMTAIEARVDAINRFKEAAKELNQVWLVAAQLTRGGQSEMKNWRFSAQAVAGGDEIKQAADIMIGVTSPKSWLRQHEPDPTDDKLHAIWAQKIDAWRGRSEVGVFKNRDDEADQWVTIGFNPALMQFADLER